MTRNDFDNLCEEFNEMFEHPPIASHRKDLLFEDIKNIEKKFFVDALNNILFNYNKWDGFSMASIAKLTKEYSSK